MRDVLGQSTMIMWAQKRDVTRISVPEDQVFFPVRPGQDAPCFFANKTRPGVIHEYLPKEKMFTVDINPFIVWSLKDVEIDSLPDEVGAPLYFNKDGKITKQAAGALKFAYFREVVGGTILCQLAV